MRRVGEAELPATLCVPEDTWEMYSCLHGPTVLKILGTKSVELHLTGSSGIHCTLHSVLESSGYLKI
jgi:hypothetical protein